MLVNMNRDFVTTKRELDRCKEKGNLTLLVLNVKTGKTYRTYKKDYFLKDRNPIITSFAVTQLNKDYPNLNKRHRKFIAEIAGKSTVEILKLDKSFKIK